jgi:lipoprotein-releasing system permease protein
VAALMNAGLVFRIAGRQLFSRSHSLFIRTVSVLSVAGIAIGVSALILLQAFMGGFQSSIRQYLAALNPPVLVRAPGGSGLAPGDLEMVARLAGALEGVTAVSPIIEKTAVAAGTGGEVAGIMVRGVDWDTETGVTRIGDSVDPGVAASGAVMGPLLAARLGLAEGDTMRMASTESATLSGTGRILVDTIVPVRVAAIVDMGLEEYNETLVFTDISLARTLFSRTGFATAVGVGLDSDADPVAVSAVLNEELREEYVSARHPAYLVSDAFLSFHGNLFRALGLEKMAMTVVLALITVVALLNLSSAISMISLEHRRDTGVLRAMGASPVTVLGTSVAQGGMIGTMGALAGLAFSGLSLFAVNRFFPIRLESSVYWIDVLPGRFQPGVALLITLATVAACLLVSVLPAAASLHRSPAESVRYE